MAEKNPAGAATELYNLERKSLAYNCGLAILLNEVTAEAEALGAVLKDNGSALVCSRSNLALYNIQYYTVVLLKLVGML